MAPNHKLTNVIKGRKVVGTSNEDGKTIISFDDGSTLRVKTGASSTGNATNATAVAPSGNAAANDAATGQNQQNLMPLQAKRSDVFRNLQWNETAFNDDVSRQGAQENVAPTQIQAIETAKTSETTAANSGGVSTNQAASGGTIKSVMQGDTTMTLLFEDGGKMDIPLQEATSSVMLRAKDNLMEYAD